jgi:hypothetical protein
MKINTLTILICMITLFVSCKNDDENPTQQPEAHPIEGKWELISITGGWNTLYFNEGDYIYQFYDDGTMIISIGEDVEVEDDFSIYGLNFTYTINDSMINFVSDNYPNNPFSTYYTIEEDSMKIGANISHGGNIDSFKRID